MRWTFYLCILLSTQLWAKAPNILMIAIDDLKPILGAYGDDKVKTPHIDALAKRGAVMLNAHVQQAVCGPSRASILTGLRPDQTQVWDLKTKMRDKLPNVVTLPQYFKTNGFNTTGTGKIFDYRCVDSREQQDAVSWTIPYRHHETNPDSEFGCLDPNFVQRVRAIEQELIKTKGKAKYNDMIQALGGKPTFEGHMDVPDDAYDDGRIASTALDLIDLLSKKDKPFFLTVGFKKPHLPFVAPKKYWDLYDRNDFKVSTSKSLPKGAPSMAFQDSWELKNGSYSIKTNEKGFEPEFEQTMIHGYYASVSYTDAQVGRVLDHLKAKGLSENTVVLLWGDHGFHLGDHGMWCKHTNYEQSTRAPLIVADPRQTFALSHSDEPAEFIDVFPTLAELAGIPIPLWLEGKSLVSHLALNTPHKSFAVSQFPRNHQGKELMGYAYRTRDHRYIHWVDNQFSKKQKKNAPVLFEELYDYQNDPKETINFTNDPNYKSKLTSLRRLAQQHRRMMDQKIK